MTGSLPIDNEGILAEPCEQCANCGAEGRLRHKDLRDPMFGAPGSWSIRQCVNPACGLGWADPQPLTSEIGKLYADYYTHGSGTGDHQGYRSGGAKGIIKNILGYLFFWNRPVFHTDLLHLQGKAPGRLLEVGCGSGSFLAAATRAGWSATGIDFDEKAISAARQIKGVDARIGDLFEQGFPEGAFDAIVMNNVIEHLPHPGAVFEECYRIMTKGGRLVMITPNIDALGHQIFGRFWRGLETPRHLYLFNNRALKSFGRVAGFRTIYTFSSVGHGMIEASKKIAENAGTPVENTDPRRLRRKALLRNLLGASCGEWVVLVAEK